MTSSTRAAQPILSALRLLIIARPDDAWWTFLLVWFIRFLTVSIVLRTYIVPWGLGLLFSRFRVRSVSLRSIRGVYFRQGRNVWHIDRIGLSYHRPSKTQASRLTVVVQGLKLAIAEPPNEPTPPPQKPAAGHRRVPTLADFSPSPIAFKARQVIYAIYAGLEPHLRPLVRASIIFVLRALIRCLPALTQVLDFELVSAELSLAELPDVQFKLKELGISTKVVFTQVEKVAFKPRLSSSRPLHRRHSRFLSMVDWKSRLSDNISRTWAGAWGDTRGTASLTIHLNDLSATQKSGSQRDGNLVFHFPSSNFHASLDVNSQRGIEPHSLEISVGLESINLTVNLVQELIGRLKSRKPIKSPLTPPSPFTPATPSLSSLASPSIHFMPLRRGSAPRGDPKKTLLDTLLSAVKLVRTKVATVNLQFRASDSISMAMNLQNLELSVGLSDPEEHLLHREVLGRNKCVTGVDSEVYSARFSMQRVGFQRVAQPSLVPGVPASSLVIASVGKIQLDVLASQLTVPFMSRLAVRKNHRLNHYSGDPNSAVLALRFKVASVDITHDWESIRDLLRQQTRQRAPSTTPPPDLISPNVLSPQEISPREEWILDNSVVEHFPRVHIDVELGSVRLSVPLSSCVQGETQAAVEMKTAGVVFCLDSDFIPPPHQPKKIFAYEEATPMRMRTLVACNVEPLELGVRVGVETHGSFGAGETDETSFEPLLTVDTLNISANGMSSAMIKDDGVTVLDISSTFLDLHCSTDAVSVELWHAEVASALSQILDAFKQRPKPPPPHPWSKPIHKGPHLLDRLPIGVAATIAIDRFTVFVTSPDLNPTESTEITRGIAFHTGFSVHFCSILPCHVAAIGKVSDRHQTRHKLYLPEEPVIHAINKTTSRRESDWTSDIVKITLWDTGIRSAISTACVADDPYCLEDLTSRFNEQNTQFLYIPNARVDLVYPGIRAAEWSGDVEDKWVCEAGVKVPTVKLKLELVHAYCVLLAVRGLKELFAPSPPGPEAKAAHEPTGSNVPAEPTRKKIVQLQASVNALELLFSMSEGKAIAARMNDFNLQVTPARTILISWPSCFFWVPRLKGLSERLEGPVDDHRWEEFISMQSWDVTIDTASRTGVSITVQGEMGRVRIPHNFILSELVLAITLSIKSMKHLVEVVGQGKFREMDIPVKEDAKKVPKMVFKIRRLIAEAADDPFESKLGLISRAGSKATEIIATHQDAFEAKVATIRAAESQQNGQASQDELDGYHFSTQHSVPIEEARQRLLAVHAKTWREVHRQYHAKQIQWNRSFYTPAKPRSPNVRNMESTLIPVAPIPDGPPLIRLVIDGVNLQIGGPSFPMERLPDFLFDIGSGQPRDSEYSLLVPLNLDLAVSSIVINLRDYPLPLFAVNGKPRTEATALTFRTDLVVAEQMGLAQSVEWCDCVIVEEDFGVRGASQFHFGVPKTIMPVKTYANPEVNATTRETTEICWGISYSYTVQDVMRILETLSSAPRDSSPSVGFWDKLRLILHWKLRASFKGDVHFHIKGSRDPYTVLHNGAGFALCWSGNTRILIGQPNPDGELIQVISDTMSVAVPNFEEAHADADPSLSSTPPRDKARGGKPGHQNVCELRKVCAELSSGVRFGVRFDLERSCGSECEDCGDLPAFKRKCRHFTFRPHYDVVLETKQSQPGRKTPEDSYNGFRSDFIHMSLSLTSSVEQSGVRDNSSFSNFYLTPKTFALFWHWVSLFDSRMSLPIRQGKYFKHKLVNPKFSQHIATIKYRITVPRLFISHVYPDESRQSWSDGITRFVGMKALIDHFHADMHQRDEESTQFNPSLGTSEVVRHKSLHHVEVVLRGVHLRAMLGTFQDPVKNIVLPDPPEEGASGNKFRSNLPTVGPDSIWFDKDDFVELDWSSRDTPVVNLLRAAECPHFVYTKCPVEKQNAKVHRWTVFSKFGNEDTHSCYLGKEPSSAHIQAKLVGERIEELRKTLSPRSRREETTLKMIDLLEEYAAVLSENQAAEERMESRSGSYYIATDTVPVSEWLGFENVYQVHCPRLFLNESVRDVLMQYYYCSRARRGFEYHLATRAVKFIRDQEITRPVKPVPRRSVDGQGSHNKGIAQAMQMLRQSFSSKDTAGGLENTLADAYTDAPRPGLNPLEGWKEGVSLKQSHFCVFLKPQIVLHSELSEDSTCVVAAGVTKFKINNIMDNENADDPINGNIMSRTYIGLQGVQIFAPSKTSSTKDECVPVEVLVDFKCESNDFDRLVPQTEATIRYDRFNQLRLRGSTSMHDPFPDLPNMHLKFQTDLINIWVPQFTVSASDSHFSAISDIVTSLLLFSDPARKSRLERLETLLFSYDFTDFGSSANVVSGLQSRLREAVNQEQDAQWRLRRFAATEDQAKLEMAKIRADVLALADELAYIFEAIRLAQGGGEGNSEHKSALLLLASSPEISWKMLDSRRDLLAKLSVNGVKFSWLNRQDSAVVNTLRIGDLHVYDGYHDAVWPEILCKHHEPKDHHLVRRDVFAILSWIVLAPVGGISIYEKFEVDLHPLRLQLDAKVGQRIMEYIWPARKNRRGRETEQTDYLTSNAKIQPPTPIYPSPQDLSPGSSHKARQSMDHTLLAPIQVRRLGGSRSFTDLRSAGGSPMSASHMNRSTDAFSSPTSPIGAQPLRRGTSLAPGVAGLNDAAIMKTRSAQKTFVAVDIASISVFLSIQKEAAFLLRDARINTRDLHYRNQTWSFEELVEQFIPSDPTWKGWVKMALHQPFFEVIPVARELISKTKRIAAKSVQQSASTITPHRPKPMKTSERPLPKTKDDPGPSNILANPFTDEPETMSPGERPKIPSQITRNGGPIHRNSHDRDRPRVTSMFRRSTTSHSRGTSNGDNSIASLISSAHNIANNASRTIHSHPSNTTT